MNDFERTDAIKSHFRVLTRAHGRFGRIEWLSFYRPERGGLEVLKQSADNAVKDARTEFKSGRVEGLIKFKFKLISYLILPV